MSDSHNELTNQFIQVVVRRVIEDGGGYAELMTVLESIVLGVMIANVRAFGMKPATSSGLTEACIQRAIDRFTEQTG